jgi:hypothetical protein
MGKFNIRTIPEVNTRWGGDGCRVIGCESDLSKEKVTNKKYRLCQTHKACDALLINGTPCRFCSQCSSLRPVLDFEGAKRGCKACSKSTTKKTSRFSSKTPKIGKEDSSCPSESKPASLESIHDRSFKNMHAEASMKGLLAIKRRSIAKQDLALVVIQLIEVKNDVLKMEGGVAFHTLL